MKKLMMILLSVFLIDQSVANLKISASYTLIGGTIPGGAVISSAVQ